MKKVIDGALYNTDIGIPTRFSREKYLAWCRKVGERPDHWADVCDGQPVTVSATGVRSVKGVDGRTCGSVKIWEEAQP